MARKTKKYNKKSKKQNLKFFCKKYNRICNKKTKTKKNKSKRNKQRKRKTVKKNEFTSTNFYKLVSNPRKFMKGGG